MKGLSKRLWASALSLLVAGSFMVSASAVGGKYGDINADGKVNSSDALVALKQSVGSSTLADDLKVLADVNADGKINSSDALEILMVSVGKKAKFPVEIKIPSPSSKEDMLNVYADALSKARNEIPSFKLKETEKAKDSEISGLFIDLLPKNEAEELKKSFASAIASDSVTQNLLSKGSQTALSCLPVDLTVKDASKFKNVTCNVLSDGNYQIVIELKDEENPKTGSVACKVMNLPDFATASKALEAEAESMGSQLSVTLSLESLSYKNCKIVSTIDSTTGEFISLTVSSDTRMSIDASFGLPMNIKITRESVAEYTNFGY